MKQQYGYEIREKDTQFIAGDDGGLYFYTEDAATESAKRYINNFLIPDEYEDKTLDDFDIIIQKINP